MGGNLRLVIGLLACAVALAGCATETASFKPPAGASAVQIARHVPGCSQVRAVGGSGAACELDGRVVDFFAVTSTQQHHALTVRVPESDAYGAGWFARLRDAAPLLVQRQMMVSIAKALVGRVMVHDVRQAAAPYLLICPHGDSGHFLRRRCGSWIP